MSRIKSGFPNAVKGVWGRVPFSVSFGKWGPGPCPLVAAAAMVVILSASAGYCQDQGLEKQWGDFLHYTAIGRLDLAEGFGQAILDSSPDPVRLLELSESTPEGYRLLLRIQANEYDESLKTIAAQLLAVIEQGRYIRRADPKIIAEEIRRLSSTVRGRLTALERLKNAGEYAVTYMLDAMSDPARKEEFANIVWALGRLDKAAIRPLAASLQMDDVAIKIEVIRALGKIGYPQSLAYLKYIVENDKSRDVCRQARNSIREIDPAALKIPAAELFFRLGQSYYNRSESLAPAAEKDFANVWFWDEQTGRVVPHRVNKAYFNELMAMRSCEWALKAEGDTPEAIALWLSAFFRAESYGLDMPEYFGQGHADAGTYATTAGPEYLHRALERAVKNKNAYVALGIVEALAVTAGEKSLLYRLGVTQPLISALSFPDRAVRYSAAIAIASAGPRDKFAESKLVVENLAEALTQPPADDFDRSLADSYATRAAEVMLALAVTNNKVIDLTPAQGVLIEATKDKRAGIQVFAGKILARLNSPDAQRAIAAAALAGNNDMNVRISAFKSLAVSAKLNANLLDEEKINAIYSLISSSQSDAELRSAAAAAYGALNLPSRKVKDLILDQARS